MHDVDRMTVAEIRPFEICKKAAPPSWIRSNQKFAVRSADPECPTLERNIVIAVLTHHLYLANGTANVSLAVPLIKVVRQLLCHQYRWRRPWIRKRLYGTGNKIEGWEVDESTPTAKSWRLFLDPEGSLSATTVVLVVTRFRKMPKALLICNGKLRNFAYTFVTSFPTDLPS